jgi:hypothetical protein
MLNFEFQFVFLSVRSSGWTPWNTAQHGHGVLMQRISGIPATYLAFDQRDAAARDFMKVLVLHFVQSFPHLFTFSGNTSKSLSTAQRFMSTTL